MVDGEGRPTPAAPDFSVEVAVGDVSDLGRRPLTIAIKRTSGGADLVERGLRVVLETQTAAPHWLVPGVFYGENRPRECQRVFPRFEVGANDPENMISDHWEFRTDRATTPAVFMWSQALGAALVTEELSPLGPTGVGLRHDAASGRAQIYASFPYREAPITYYGSAMPLPADTRTFSWASGQEVTITLDAYVLDSDRHGYAPVLRAAHEKLAAHAPIEPWVSVSEAAELAAHGLHAWHYDANPGVLLEAIGFDREVSGQDGKRVDRQAMHVGWVSGIPWAYALLRHSRRVGNEAQEAAALKVIDFCCAELSPSGTFWATWYRKSGWSQSWSPVKDALHARTLGEATLFLVRAIGQLPESERRERWKQVAVANLNVMAGRQRPDGNLGALHHAHTGEVLSWSGAAALPWVTAFIEAAESITSPNEAQRFLGAAHSAGEYYTRFGDDEFIYGAPEDVDLAPTSEDGYAAVMAYMALYRTTGDERWLDVARRAADWMLTFRYSYNVNFDARTTMGIYNFATRGADQASPSNQHIHAYGLLCTDEMLDLSAALDDPYYRDRALEHLACFRQAVPRVDGELNAYRGMITERYYQTDCFQPKGMVLTLSHAWSAGVLLLGCEQIISRSGSAD